MVRRNLLKVLLGLLAPGAASQALWANCMAKERYESVGACGMPDPVVFVMNQTPRGDLW